MMPCGVTRKVSAELTRRSVQRLILGSDQLSLSGVNNRGVHAVAGGMYRQSDVLYGQLQPLRRTVWLLA